MCAQSVARSTNERKLDPWNLTQQDRSVLLRAVAWKVYGRCDPEDALQYALMVALEHYDVNKEGASLKSYVLTVADHYAWNQWRHSGVDRNSTSLDAAEDADDRSRHEYLVGWHDKVEDSAIDDQAIRAIIKHIERLPNHKRISRQHAADMLETLVESIEKDAGIGVDELEAFHANEPASEISP